MSRAVVIITGPIMSGKSTLAARVVDELRRRGLALGGMVARSLWNGDDRYGFDMVDLANGSVTPLARKQPAGAARYPVPFDFFEDGLLAGRLALDPERCAACDVVFLDEVGKLEVADQGWAPLMPPLLALDRPVVVLIIRDFLVETALAKWSLHEAHVVNASDEHAYEKLLNLLILSGK